MPRPKTANDALPSRARLIRIVIQLPLDLKQRLDDLKEQGYTVSGFIRAVLEREFSKLTHKNVDHEPDGNDRHKQPAGNNEG